MSSFKIYLNKRLVVLSVLIICIWWILSCTYEPLQPPKMPKFYQTINLPLVDVCLPLSDMRNPENNIDTANKLLQFEFTGELDTATLTKSIFTIPTGVPVTIEQKFPDMRGYNKPRTIPFGKTIRLSDILPFNTSKDTTFEFVPRMPLDKETRDEIFDKYGIPSLFDSVEYMTVGSGTFKTTIKNKLLMDLDSVHIQMSNVNGNIIADTLFIKIKHNEFPNYSKPLTGVDIEDSVKVVLSAWLHGTDEPLTIPAGSDPYMTIDVSVSIDDIESFTGDPAVIDTIISKPLPSSNITIIHGIFGETATDPLNTNLIQWDIVNETPLNMRMQISLLNFYDEDGAITIDETLSSGDSVTNFERLDLDTFRNLDKTTVVEEFSVLSYIELLPDEGSTLTTIFLDSEGGSLNGNIKISSLNFKEIEGYFHDVSIPISPMTIQDIPTGFGDVVFDSVWLELYLFNEFQASIKLILDISGFRVDLPPKDTSYTVNIEGPTESNDSGYCEPAINIAPIFNMMPDSIVVSGEASIQGSKKTRLVVGQSLWGNFGVVVPFRMKINEMTFIPVKSNELSPMDETTRQRIREGLIESGITYKVINDFPLSGKVDLLMSNFDYFPLSPDSVDSSIYQWNDTYDTLYTNTDTGIVSIIIDTLVTIELPTRDYDNEGKLKEFNGNSVIDSTMLEKIIGDEKHYIRPRIHLDSTRSYVSIQYNDEIDIVAILSLTMEAGAFFGNGDAEQDTLPSDSSLKKPIIMRDADKPDLLYINKNTDEFGLKIGKSSKENVLK